MERWECEMAALVILRACKKTQKHRSSVSGLLDNSHSSTAKEFQKKLHTEALPQCKAQRTALFPVGAC